MRHRYVFLLISCIIIPTNFLFYLDIRDLISLDDVQEELKFGPNGGLVYCMEYLIENIEWLLDEL